jgi:hypothetical protein
VRVKYFLSEQPHEFEIGDSSDLAEVCPEIEGRLRSDHPELANQSFLTERVADALLNSLAAEDGQEVDLGDLSSRKNRLCRRQVNCSTYIGSQISETCS